MRAYSWSPWTGLAETVTSETPVRFLRMRFLRCSLWLWNHVWNSSFVEELAQCEKGKGALAGACRLRGSLFASPWYTVEYRTVALSGAERQRWPGQTRRPHLFQHMVHTWQAMIK